MKTIIYVITICILLIFGCNTSKVPMDISHNDFEIISSSYNNWTSGMRGGGIGSDFYITLVSNIDNVIIDSIQLHNVRVKTISKLKNTNQFYDFGNIKYTKGDSIEIRASLNSHYKEYQNINNYLLYYSSKERKKLIIGTFVKLPQINQQ